MKENSENKNGVSNDEIYDIVASGSFHQKRFPWLWVFIGFVALVMAIFIVFIINRDPSVEKSENIDVWYKNTDEVCPACAIVSDTLIDNIHLSIITPYNAVPELHVGPFDTTDVDVVFAALAADLGYDKGKIIGAFVYKGEPLSWGGGRKLGYCAIIDGKITLGVSESSPLFEQATEQGGYFFRQYPAVDNGVMVENNPKNASFRRALCALNGNVCIVTTPERVLMNDFSSALAKLGVENAIFLIGGTADGCYRTADGTFHRIGEEYIKGNPNINYIVFRSVH